MALEAVTILGGALSMAQVGDLYIASLARNMNLIYSQTTGGAETLRSLDRHFTFGYEDEFSSDLSLPNFIVQSREFFAGFGDDKRNICLILSDGRMNKELLRAPLADAEQNECLYLYIILDKPNPQDSIVNYKTTQVEKIDGKSKVSIKPYLQDFPFRYYIIVNVR